ncbi:gliding motility lipoprotein GldJ [Flavipsychrobacter stenotrophus]|uniref:Gliding motility lipoprotein GldJ n=1 Tax=Flavipsychrobacter stenotrophus TaxID=2077091 RepID=A0A2S7SXR6_9BACT|nr:SUMF1/EgtB/PvdO family nonheme iron enzyme [Flavipsychrobacter stenotrophus]PQJ11508.1 gliding motility lipoprotein GldJ [Flavipsychrobacter stenotrophus]
MKRKLIGVTLLCIGVSTLFSACTSRSRKEGKGDGFSNTTGWPLNDRRWGGFDVALGYQGQQTPVGMTLVQGGRFTMGAKDDELVTGENNNNRRTVSVSSFYMDETELANISYREYIYWLGRAYANDLPEVVVAALPDSTVWRSPLGYNEPYVKNYFRAAAYDNYPVVGVNWYQASDYCKWRTDRVNEYLLIAAGALQPNVNQTGEDVFTTETYMNGQYQGTNGGRQKSDLDANGSGTRPYNMSDGIFMPDYRLPTEAEWEYAALGSAGNNPAPETKRRRGEEVVTDNNVYGWGPRNTTRYDIHNMYQGEFMGNFMRGAGDYMGVAGGLNDNADITAKVRTYHPNALGLYNMAGNVNEWVMDTYRPNSHDDVDGFRSFRGNEYMRQQFQEDGTVEERDSTGHIPYTRVPANESSQQGRQIRSSNLYSYKDGDTSYAGGQLDKMNYGQYQYGINTLINDSTKVYKGGSWADRAYWLAPGTRRYIQGNLSSNTIGFRCVVDRLGSPNGNNEPAGNGFGREKNRRR